MAVQLTSNKEFPCPDEHVQYECTVEGGVLVWSITPPAQIRQGSTFLKGIDSINQVQTLSWPDLSSSDITVTYTSVNETHMESTADIVAVPEFYGTRIDCSGTVLVTKVLWIASKFVLEIPESHNTVCRFRDLYSQCLFMLLALAVGQWTVSRITSWPAL